MARSTIASTSVAVDTSVRTNVAAPPGCDDRLRRRLAAIHVDVGDDEPRALACER